MDACIKRVFVLQFCELHKSLIEQIRTLREMRGVGSCCMLAKISINCDFPENKQ